VEVEVVYGVVLVDLVDPVVVLETEPAVAHNLAEQQILLIPHQLLHQINLETLVVLLVVHQ
tara:strand:- start:413 stop:595 length:183 start_codon:yes stop_codon:yes gene_type:complete